MSKFDDSRIKRLWPAMDDGDIQYLYDVINEVLDEIEKRITSVKSGVMPKG